MSLLRGVPPESEGVLLIVISKGMFGSAPVTLKLMVKLTIVGLVMVRIFP